MHSKPGSGAEAAFEGLLVPVRHHSFFIPYSLFFIINYSLFVMGCSSHG
jgi:hypothetical protein